MKLSILILTHNRPELFNRALSSIFNTDVGSGLNIYVNNDTCDIQEIESTDHDIKYYYKTYDDLTDTYKFLFDIADEVRRMELNRHNHSCRKYRLRRKVI